MKILIFELIVLTSLFIYYNTDMDSFNNLLELRTLDLSEIQEHNYIKEEHIETNSEYQNLIGLTKVYNPEFFPGLIFFRNDKVVLIYSSDPEIVGKLNVEKIIKQYGDKDENTLRSRSGKRSNLMVYPEEGFAVSVESNDVDFIELFQPTTIEQYKNEIYINPGPFIR